jgi:hypothetical protein
MKKHLYLFYAACTILLLSSPGTSAQNPFIMDQFTADPSARVFNDRVYVFPSHDILASEDRGRIGWFCMEDYHVFSSPDLTDWTDHGVIVHQEKVDWVDPASYSMWAPDCIFRDGKYYFYFPSHSSDISTQWRFTVGVAVADRCEGPYTPQAGPIRGIGGVDPNPFIDKDGQAYLYWSMGQIFAAKLKKNMLELASDPRVVDSLPGAGLKEGPYLFERNGIYYMTYPHAENTTERLEYATGDNPLGPFRVTGVIMDESPTGCWTNHHSIIEFKGQWYLFYHHNDLSPKFDKARSIRIDSLFFNPDGTIRKVRPTLRGVGLTGASEKIQLDRYSRISDRGASVAFLDTLDTFKGWKTILDKGGAWISYNSVDFGNGDLTAVRVKASSEKGGRIQVRLDRTDGPVLAGVDIPAGTDWNTLEATAEEIPAGIHHLVITLEGDQPVEIDWIRFL